MAHQKVTMSHGVVTWIKTFLDSRNEKFSFYFPLAAIFQNEKFNFLRFFFSILRFLMSFFGVWNAAARSQGRRETRVGDGSD